MCMCQGQDARVLPRRDMNHACKQCTISTPSRMRGIALLNILVLLVTTTILTVGLGIYSNIIVTHKAAY